MTASGSSKSLASMNLLQSAAPFEPDLQTMLEVDAHLDALHWEQVNRRVIAEIDARNGMDLCAPHRTGERPIPQTPMLARTTLLPICDECCLMETGIHPRDLFPPLDGCFCATQAVVSECWLCTLEQMEQAKAQAIGQRTRTLKPSGKKILLCKCGKHIDTQIMESNSELVRQCACCYGVVVSPFTNCFGENLVFERITTNVVDFQPAPPRPPLDLRMLTAAGRASLNSEAHPAKAATAEGGQADETTASSTISPTTALTVLDKRASQSSRGKRKVDGISKDSHTSLTDDVDEDPAPPMAKRQQVPRRTARQIKPTSLRKNTLLANHRRIDNAVPNSKPADPITESAAPTLRRRDIYNYAKEAMKPMVYSLGELNMNGDGLVTASVPPLPSYINHPGRNAAIGVRKDVLLKRDLKDNATALPPTHGSPMDLLAGVESDFRRNKANQVLGKEAYDEQLVVCGFDLETRRKIGTFVRRVWNEKVVVTQVRIVARIALSYCS